MSTEGLKINPEKVAVVVDWPAPTNLRQAQSFIGFCNFYRRFIRDFSKIARPLTRLARKDIPFQWNSDCEGSFVELKRQITSAPVLRHFDRSRESFLETDSSDYVSGGVLSQKDDEGRLHPVAFYSKNLLPAECNYEIYDKELLAIIKCFEHWRPELEFTEIPVQVFSDHASLKHFMTTKVLTRRQARWAEMLSEYNFIINIRPGTQNGKADALTRLPGSLPQDDEDDRRKFQEQTLLPQTRFSVDCAETQSISLFERIKQANIEDPQCHEIRAAQAKGQERFEGISLEHCIEKDNTLYWKEALWVPQDSQLVLAILQEAHNLPSGGHKGVAKTVDLIKRYYYWPGMRESIKQYIRNCYECHRAKAPTDRKNGLLQPLPIPEQRWLDISLDFITGLPKTTKGNNAILNIIDRLSKERHYIACVSGDEGTSTEETLNILIDHVYRLHGAPASIVSDRGPQFISALWKSFNRRLGTQMNLSTAFHPETDGQTERANQDIEIFLRAYTCENQDDWDRWLPMAEFADNNSIASATGLSPFFVNKGFHPRISFGSDPTEPTSTRERLQASTAQIITDKMEEILHFAKAHAAIAQERMTNQANKSRKDIDYQLGNQVFLSAKNIRTERPSQKLDHKMLGPFPIVAKVGYAYRLELPPTMKIHNVFHPGLLRRAPEDPLPGQKNAPPPPVVVDGKEEWTVDEILDAKQFGRGKRLKYRVKWSGYDRDLAWYNADSDEFANSQDLIDDFHKRYPDKPAL